MISKHRQRGMSMWSLLGVLAVIGFALLIVVKLTPVYLTYWSVASVSESVINDTGPDDSMAEIWDKITTRFDLNNIRTLDPKKIMKIKRKSGSIEIDVQYERRKHLVHNVALVVTFDRTFGP